MRELSCAKNWARHILFTQEKSYQITHLILGYGGLQSFRHEGPVEGLHVLDRAAGDGLLGSAHHGEHDGVAGFVLDEATKAAAVFRLDGVSTPAGFEHAVGVEDVGEQTFGRLHLHVREWWSNIDAQSAVLVASNADG